MTRPRRGYQSYEALIAEASSEEPDVMVDGDDVWNIMYTSGTTGRPKGVIRTHEGNVAQYVLNGINMGLRPDDCVMLVMPMCHINSIYYSFTYTYVSARVFVYNMISFDPEDLLRTIEKEKITFTSLVPTHYIMMLSLPDEIKRKIDVSSIRQLLISSAPARKDTKLAIMDYFKNAELWEAYGSTEAGLVTLLRPEEQFKKLGSIGREIWGTDRIKILDEKEKRFPGDRWESFIRRTPQIFKEYWKDPEKTKSVFQGEWFSAGDMAMQDEEGYFVLVDRKANMIITGGENVFPSEVENMIGAHPAVKYVAVIGIPHEKWGESVKAVVTLHPGKDGDREGADRLLPGEDRRVQNSEVRRLHQGRGDAHDPDRKDPAPDPEREVWEMERCEIVSFCPVSSKGPGGCPRAFFSTNGSGALDWMDWIG